MNQDLSTGEMIATSIIAFLMGVIVTITFALDVAA